MHIHVLNMPKRQKKNYIFNYSKDTRKRNGEIVFSIYMLTEQFLIVFDIKKNTRIIPYMYVDWNQYVTKRG